MKFEELHNDAAALAELGRRLAQLRIGQQLSQAELARKAGIGKRTLERLEAGDTTQTKTLLRVLRELDFLERLELLLPEPKARPSQVVKAEELPKRVSRARGQKRDKDPWKWGDER